MSITIPSTTLLTAHIFHRAPLSNKKFKVTFIHERELYSSTEPLDAFLRSASSLSAPFGLAGMLQRLPHPLSSDLSEILRRLC
jgi:hypothetical protein